MQEELSLIQSLSQELQEKEKTKKDIESGDSPKEIITNSLVEFFLFRLKRLYKDLEFQATLKEELESRLPEADFNDIKMLLHQEAENTNKAIQNLFLPFFYKLQEIQTAKDISLEEQISASLPSDLLQSLNELTSFLSVLKPYKDSNQDIKEKLKLSLVETQSQNPQEQETQG